MITHDVHNYLMTDWRRVTRLPNAAGDGHRIFQYTASGHHAGPFRHRLAIADNSGSAPHLTDDGVLWLDTTRPLVLEDAERFGLRVNVPVRNNEGGEYHCIMGIRAAAKLRALVPTWQLTLAESVHFLPELFGLPENVLTRSLA